MAEPEDVEQLLDRSRTALLAGDLAALTGLAAGTEQALESLDACDSGVLARLVQKARQNEMMIAAALRGVHAAMRRARDLTDEGRFSTYDSGGRRNQPGLTLPEVPRRF